MVETPLEEILGRIEKRLDAMDDKLDELTRARTKAFDWIGQLSEHIESLDAFREEVRASFEPILGKLDHLDEMSRILRHATADVSRRIETIEPRARKVI